MGANQIGPTSLISRSSINPTNRPSELLEDVHHNEVHKLKDELYSTKQELKKERESALVMIKKMKSQSEAIGLVKEHKHGRTISKMEDEYQNELQNVNKKLMITQNLHVKELEKLRKQDIAHKLEIKLKNK